MFCPRCGSTISEGLKYCRNCGLPISQVSTYVATGGTANLASPQSSEIEASEYLTPKQRLVLTIALVVLSPAIFAVIAESFNLAPDLAAIPAVLIPIGILWATFHYKAVVRRRAREQAIIANNSASNSAMAYPVQPVVQGAATYQSQLPPQRTNPLTEASRGSVIEDETRKLP